MSTSKKNGSTEPLLKKEISQETESFNQTTSAKDGDIKKFNKKKWPSSLQWRQFFKIISKKEKVSFFVFFVLAISSFIFLSTNFYFKNTKIEPASGGIYSEGVLGQPRFINPIYANSDPDRDLVQLMFSGLMKYNGQMEIVPDLIEQYEVSRDRKTYIFHLRKNLLWQDKEPLNANDILFTIKTIQDPDAKSPLRANWVGVKVEKVDDLTIKFKLQKPYSAFLENCTLKILPRHIWKNIAVKNLPLENHYNLNPIGSGPYKIKELKSSNSDGIKSVLLVRNNLYFGKKPNISKVKFFFFSDEKELIKAAKERKIQGLSLNSLTQIGGNWQNYLFSFPRYFAVFFNQDKTKSLAQKQIRLALNYATNKKEIVEKILNLKKNYPGLQKEICQSPILPQVYGFKPPIEIYNFDIQKAREILEKAGFKKNKNGIREKRTEKKPAFVFSSRLEKGSQGKEVKELQKCLTRFPTIYPQKKVTGYFGAKTEQAIVNFQKKYSKDILEPWHFSKGTGIVGKTTRKKLNEICFPAKEDVLSLKFSLVTVSQPQIIKVAQILKKQWKEIGVEIEIKDLPLPDLEQNFLKPRSYEILLLGEVLGAIPDPLPFWHSSQKIDPGLNMSLYANKKADSLLEENRESSNPETREKKLEDFQNIVIKDAPAVFLYSPDFIYSVSKKVKGIKIKKIANPSNRFTGIENWYIKTKRAWK